MSFKNKRTDSFLASISTSSIESMDDDLSTRCKFNFSYLDFSQSAGQSLDDWSPGLLLKLNKKLIEYSKKPLNYWSNQRVGAGGLKVFEIYGNFPKRSDFTHPKYVPHQACWARFRLEQKVRLIGFIVPENYNEIRHVVNGALFDCNTFYIVFLDRDHRFYLTEKS